VVRRYAEVLHVYREASRVRECHALLVPRSELILVYQPIPGTLRESAAEVGQADHNAKNTRDDKVLPPLVPVVRCTCMGTRPD